MAGVPENKTSPKALRKFQVSKEEIGKICEQQANHGTHQPEKRGHNGNRQKHIPKSFPKK
jgi:hypothetical protein